MKYHEISIIHIEACDYSRSLNTLRNQASIAHPNDNILEEAEAILAINSGRTLLNYLDSKL